MPIFEIGSYFPPSEEQGRIDRYRNNKYIFKGKHGLVFNQEQLNEKQAHSIYISTNLAKLICIKSADFLFGETPIYSAGKNDDSNEQKAIERLVVDNDLNTTNYESALGNSYRGDSFYKIRWGQKYGGLLSKDIDPFRVIIESQKAEYVFVETMPGDTKTIYAYHIAFPQVIEETGDQEWVLKVESHYPGKIVYSEYKMTPIKTSKIENEVITWKIESEHEGARSEVETGVPFPLVVHVPNYTTDDDCLGIDDISESESLFDEINNRLSKIAEILDKHSDPAMVVPVGSLDIDERGNPVFHTGRDKVFEAEKNDLLPQYITWNGQLEAAFKELDKLVDQVLLVSEIPPVALGKDNSGTSGASGLSIKWRMNSLLSKINRKRQYYDKALRQVLLIAQMLEHSKVGKEKLGYDITIPKIKFRDGLPDDEMEQATIAQVRTGGKPTQSQLGAIMEVNGFTEEQARIELERIREEERADSFVDTTVFNNVEVEE
ncbi:phage portal protein [Heyndrickxia oleronia]|uniref:phage portal protein n=1 Tax=Heyndrickxia oleronia TaxID=38875 RepID=UPI001C0EABDC|nr:phage portal protein [Heyndrickxia oleronia]MBU5211063.1 phage portal protein [Heyndrickxia oleronia]